MESVISAQSQVSLRAALWCLVTERSFSLTGLPSFSFFSMRLNLHLDLYGMLKLRSVCPINYWSSDALEDPRSTLPGLTRSCRHCRVSNYFRIRSVLRQGDTRLLRGHVIDNGTSISTSFAFRLIILISQRFSS